MSLPRRHINKMILMAAHKYRYHRLTMSSHRRNTFQNLSKIERGSKMISTVAFKKISVTDNNN